MQQELHNLRLSGRRIAVIEDEFLIAKDICDVLATEGAEIVGPFSRIKNALRGLATSKPDVVLLDLNLAGLSSLPIAQYLVERKIPFVILSGYGPSMITEELLRTAPMIQKPFDGESLIGRLLVVL